MKRTFKCLMVASMMALGAAAYAQETDSTERTQNPGVKNRDKVRVKTEHTEKHAMRAEGDFRLQRASELIGEEVKNAQGENLGKISELAINVDEGRVAYAVLDFGGFLGIGSKLFAVPFEALDYRPDVSNKNDERFVFNIDKDRLRDAPGFDKSNWPDMADERFSKEVYTYYGKERRPARDRHMDRDAELRGEPTAPGTNGQRDTRDHKDAKEGAHRKARILRADETIFDSDVKSGAGEDLGDIEDLLVDRHSGDVVFAVVRFNDTAKLSGRTEIGEDMMAALPWEALSLRTDNKGEQTFICKPSLQKIEGQMFSSKNWPDIADDNWSVTVYKHYEMKPYWQADGQGRDIELRREGNDSDSARERNRQDNQK